MPANQMPPKQTPLKTFEAMLTAYGSQTENWPAEAQAALEGLIEAEPKAAALFAREKSLDDWLDARLPAPSPQLMESVLASLETQIKARPAAPAETVELAEIVNLAPSPQSGPQSNWHRSTLGASLTALAACFMAGFIVGPLIFETLTGAGDPLASLEIISTVFLPTEPL
tara:strand:+ start:938 stop:1447 length:510 start_codon:yes stop_codon:yes gene_type:complete